MICGVKVVSERDEMIIIIQKDIIIRISVKEIIRTGRDSMDIEVTNMDKNDKITNEDLVLKKFQTRNHRIERSQYSFYRLY